MSDDTFFIWGYDDIDSSFFEETDNPRPLYICWLLTDTDDKPDMIRGYSPQDGIFERGGTIVGSLGGIDMDPDDDEYRKQIESELLAEFEAQREANICRSNN